MSDEITTYRHELHWILDQVIRLTAYPSDKLNWRPHSESANSAYAIVSHILSSTRVYVLGFGCAQPVSRDRSQEFGARGTSADDLITATRQLSDDIEAALSTLEARALDRRFVPSSHLFGALGEPHEMSARDAIVESIRHAAIHLGELRLTHDLADWEPA